jgi:hypothetical protein
MDTAATAVLSDNQLASLMASESILLNWPRRQKIPKNSWWEPYLQPASVDIPLGMKGDQLTY